MRIVSESSGKQELKGTLQNCLDFIAAESQCDKWIEEYKIMQ